MRLTKRSKTVVALVAAVVAALLLYHLAAGWAGSSRGARLKLYAAGSGEDMMSQPETAAEIIELSGKTTPHVLYLGTATYDDPKSQHHQTMRLAERGCTVEALKLVDHSPSASDLDSSFGKADIVLVSGGNTLYAVDRWRELGVDKRIAEAGHRGVVLAGGSAGGIVWFDGGHSDSMDPTTYHHPPGPLLRPGLSKEVLAKSWAYLRVPGIGTLPGLFCPHYDKVESNGELRAKSFETMMKMHSGETGICVDNWAALVVDGDRYRVVSRHGKHGSVSSSGGYTDHRSSGTPGAFVVRIGTDGKQSRSRVPTSGHIGSVAAEPEYVVQSPMLPVARLQNPTARAHV